MSIIYVAISKSGNVLSGAKGQYAFDNKATLKKSVNYSYGFTARQQGKHPSELYDIHEIDVNKAITEKAKSIEPFIVHEIHGTNWNDEGRMELGVDGREVMSISSLSECPEDASLERDLDFVYNISDWLEEAHKAGSEGRPFQFISEDEEEEE
jgi:hypothetical protein